MIHRYACLAVLLCLCISIPAYAGPKKVIAVGDTFPAVRSDYALSAEQLAYFGIDRGLLSLFTKNSFSIADINAEIIFVEFFNNYCSSCQAQAPVINDVYKAVQKNPVLRNKVRFIGIGAGNNEREVAQYKERHEVPFPLIPDKRFSFYDALGEPGGTPFMLILKKRDHEAVVVGTHKGLTQNASFFITSLTAAAEQDISTLTRRVTEKDIPRDDTRLLALNLTPKQTLDAAAKSMAAACPACAPATDIKQIRTASGKPLYAATVDAAGRPLTLYSSLISEQPVCDVCHGVHYIITFDGSGIIRDFTPVHLTKYGNVEWNEYDIETMRKQLMGKKLKKELVFDPALDAITTATMSSALIYKGVNELRAVYKELN
ncbi:MAG: redoxin domain-containing protein [Deltaproteobacteria bacterium]|nr:redoxin domain-containing protein [Deltaproteobacteria bacterium]